MGKGNLPPVFPKEVAEKTQFDTRTRAYISPVRVMWTQNGDLITGSENLLLQGNGQATTANTPKTVFVSKEGKRPSILLDFGREIHRGTAVRNLHSRIDQTRQGTRAPRRIGRRSDVRDHEGKRRDERPRDARLYDRTAVAGRLRSRELRLPFRPDRHARRRRRTADQGDPRQPAIPRHPVPRLVPFERSARGQHLGDRRLHAAPEPAGISRRGPEARPPGMARRPASRSAYRAGRIRRQRGAFARPGLRPRRNPAAGLDERHVLLFAVVGADPPRLLHVPRRPELPETAATIPQRPDEDPDEQGGRRRP